MKNKKKIDNRAVINIIGTILMLAITIILSAVIFQMINLQDGTKERINVDLVVDLDIKSSLEGGGGTINIVHKGGDTLDDDKTEIHIDINNERIELKISDGIEWESKKSWDIGEKWSKYFCEITKDSKVNVLVIDSENNEILMRGNVRAGLSFPDHNPPIISFSWCEPTIVPEDGTIPFKIYSAIVDNENNLPVSGTVTVNLLPISGNEAEQMSDFDDNDVFETKALKISNGTSIGTYTFKITAKDLYGNIAKGTVDFKVGSIDTISPTVEITQPSINAFVDSKPEIVGSFADNIGGSGIDESSISLKIDNKEVTLEESNITSSSITYIPQAPLENGIHTTTLSLRDKAGNEAAISLTFITGGYKEPYGMGGAQSFIILNQSGKQTTYFEEGEMVRIRVSTQFVENTDSKNRITIYDSNGDYSAVDPAFTLISNTAPYLFYDYCYACEFDAPSTGDYNIWIELWDSNGYKFSAQSNLTVEKTIIEGTRGEQTIPNYFKTYEDSNYLIESNNFNSVDNIYIKIVTFEKGEVNINASDDINIDDYILNHQIQNKPGEGSISNVQKSDSACGIIAFYTFSINLSKNQFGWLQSANWYTLSIQGLKNDNNDLIFKGATQIQIISKGKPDLYLDDNDVTLSNENPTSGDKEYISIIVHNIGICDAINVIVGVWVDDELFGEGTIPIIFANGGDEEITIQWNVKNHNTATIVIIVDPYYTISEYDETNNLITQQVIIRYPILLVDDDDGNDDNYHSTIEGGININPNNNPNNEFILTKPDYSTITKDDLHQNSPLNGDGVYYEGLASNFRVKPKGNGNQNGLIVNSHVYYFENKNTYYINGEDMEVIIYNDHINGNGKTVGHWWINVVTVSGTIQNLDDNCESWNIHIESYWKEVLNNEGYFYDLYTVPHEENGPDYDIMKDYDVVIWFSGRDNYGVGASLTAIDQTNLAMYLEDGGNFWMISQDLLYIMCNFDSDLPLTNPFAHEYLKVSDRSENEGTINPLLGVDGDQITDGISYKTSNATFNGDDYCDDLILEPDGDGIFYGPGAHYCGVRYDSGIYKVVFFAFEFMFIVNASDRVELTEKVLDWIGINPIVNDVGITSIECSDNVQINKEVDVTTNVKNFGRNNQTDFDVLCQITAQNGTVVYSNTKVLSLNSKEETVTTWQWTPDTEGTYIVSVSTQLNGDKDMTNDECSGQINVLVFYDDLENGMNEWTFEGNGLSPFFYEDFESGNLNNWVIDNNNDGGVVTCSNSEAHSGTYCVKFYGDGSALNHMYIERSFNLTGKTNVYLSWYWHDEDLENPDKGYLSIWDGTWDNDVFSLWDGTDEDHVTSPTNYEARGDPNVIKLDEYYNMIDGFKIRFGCTAIHEEEWDCLLIDDIKVSTFDTGNLWHQVDIRAHTSDTSFWCGNDSTNKYHGYLDNSIITPEINLTTGTYAELKFWHYCDFEGQTSNIDGGIVEITINNGSTWNQITPINGYDDVLEDDGVNPLGGLVAFCHDSDWVKEEFDITPYLGNLVKIRFHFSSSPTINDEGWYIDDISIYRW